MPVSAGASGWEVGISDDGVGYADGQITKGLGSRLARALAAEAQATLEVVSAPGDGATVMVRLA